MKNIIIYILIIYSILLASCKGKYQCPEQIQYRIWNGQNFSIEKECPLPVCITWQYYSRGDWKSYKSFSQGVEIRHIIDLLDSPEIKEPRPELRTDNKLTLFFSVDINYVKMFPVTPIRIVELYFDVNDGEFVCPAGKSKILWKIFTDKPESGLYAYRVLGGNCSETNINTYIKNIHTEKNKSRNEKLNTSALIQFPLGSTYDYLDKIKKTLEFIRKEEQNFKDKYSIQDANQSPQE